MNLTEIIKRFDRSRLPLALQSEAAECGLACLAMVATFHGHATDLVSLRRRFSVSAKGMSLQGLLAMARRLGLSGRGLRLEPDHLGKLNLPCILHWNMNHFVVLKEVRGKRAIIHDPAQGVIRYTLEEIGRHFTGIALELAPTSTFERRDDTARLPLSGLWGRLRGMNRALAQALLLSLVLQAVVLASPFYMQLAVDDAVMKGDTGLLGALALGFTLLLLINLGAAWLRSQILLYLGHALGFRMGANLFGHLVRLPLSWFEKRNIGDIVSRFNSINPIQKLISQSLISAIVDGLMALLTLAMILIYSPTLSIVVFAALVLSALIRLGSYRWSRRLEEEAIDAGAKENTTFIETVRAAQSIKIFGMEQDREVLWQNRFADKIGREIKRSSLDIGLTTAGQFVTGMENVILVYLGARAAIAGEMSIGMLYAFMAYKEQFSTKTAALIDMALQFRLLELHLQRISDIALSPREVEDERRGLIDRTVEGKLELRNVSFSYSETDPNVLTGANLKVSPGEFLAISGPSGGGKTTLLKVMLGLFKPQEGQVLIDGTPLEQFGIEAFRSKIGVVMQDDQLLSGTIGENISFFDPQLDFERMHSCARAAGISDEIMAMPMNYNTLVGDMGTSLSGGQRQRVLLARALYRQPRILFMDEGTSHLDMDKEREVNRALAALNMTRIVIAHRPDTLRAADRVLELRNGVLADVGEAPHCLAAALQPSQVTGA